MTRVLFYTILLLFTLNHPAMSEEKSLPPGLLTDVENKTLRPFFNALKNGNVEIIKRYITGEMYEESRILLEENKGYSEFLRERYKDAVFSVKRGVSSDRHLMVDIEVEFPGRGKQISQLRLEESWQENAGKVQAIEERRWRISKQRNDPAR